MATERVHRGNWPPSKNHACNMATFAEALSTVKSDHFESGRPDSTLKAATLRVVTKHTKQLGLSLSACCSWHTSHHRDHDKKPADPTGQTFVRVGAAPLIDHFSSTWGHFQQLCCSYCGRPSTSVVVGFASLLGTCSLRTRV